MGKFRRTKKKRRVVEEPIETLNGKGPLVTKSKRKNQINKKVKLSDEEYISGNYSCAIGMSKYKHKFGIAQWWVDAERKYNETFGTNHTQLQELCKGVI